MTSTAVAIEPDELCNDPDALWLKYISEGRVCKKHSLPKLDTPIRGDAVRVVCLSDTHEKLAEVIDRIPFGHILIFAGDMTQTGSKEKITEFNELMGKLPHKHKIVIAGNHDVGFQDNYDVKECDQDASVRGLKGTPQGYKLLSNCIYLQDSEVEVCGLRIYGSSWHPLPGFPFSLKRGQELLDKWNLIPVGIDILVTHTPPLGHNDFYTPDGEKWGCSELLNTVEKRVHPKYHVFGHVHEQNGVTTNGETIFINASISDHSLNTVNNPIIFDVPMEGKPNA